MNRADGGEESEGRGDDLVAGLEVQRHHGEDQRVGAGRAADGEWCVAVARGLGLELTDLRAVDHVLAIEDALDHGHDLTLERSVLAHEIEERDIKLGRRGLGGHSVFLGAGRNTSK